jgi:hypothetical protein
MNERQEIYSELAEQMQREVRNEVLKFNNLLITLFTSLTSLLVFLPFNIELGMLDNKVYIITLFLTISVLIISLTIHFAFIQHKSKTLDNLGDYMKNIKEVPKDGHIELPKTPWMQYIYWVRRFQMILIIVTMISGAFLGICALF